MWFQCFITISSGLLATGAYLVASLFIRSRQALSRYKKLSAGLPILDDGNPLKANHGFQFYAGRSTNTKLANWHEQHGKTFGFLFGSRACASTIDLDLIKLIIHDEQCTNRMTFHSVIPELEDDCIMTAINEQWQRIRRAFGPPIRKFKMPSLVSEIEESISNFMRSIENKLTSSGTSAVKIKLDDVMHRFTLDVVYRCFYKQNNIIDFDAEHCQDVAVIGEALRAPIDKALPLKLCFLFPNARYLIDPLVKKFTQLGEWQLRVMNFIRDQAELALRARRHLKARAMLGKAEVDRDDFVLDDGTRFRKGVIDFIIDYYLDGKLTRGEFLNSAFFLFGAADKTVCDALINLIYYLSTNQRVQVKLRDSILSGGLDSEYMEWVINEALRLHPPATIGCSRVVERDIKLDKGYILPAGTYVHTPLYVIHRHKDLWGSDADEFRPERWSDADKFYRMQFMPFGAGRRSCPGKELALFEIKSLLVKLLAKYQFSGDQKDDLCEFDTPYTLYCLPNSPTFATVRPLSALQEKNARLPSNSYAT